MFDLPTLTALDRRHYRSFVKYIKSIGFILFQESVYVKLSINEAAVKRMREQIARHLPPRGLVSLLTVTEKQFASIENMLGTFVTDVVNDDKRVVDL